MKRKFGVGALIAAGTVLVGAVPAMAQDSGAEAVQVIMDNLWVFIAGILVFLMQAGFGMVEAGMTRAKNVGNIMAKNLADMCVGALAFFAFGYGIAFGTDAGSLFGTDGFFSERHVHPRSAMGSAPLRSSSSRWYSRPPR